MAELVLNRTLRDRDQLLHVLRRRMAEVHHDVGMNVRDLRVAVAKSLEPALIDQSPDPDYHTVATVRGCLAACEDVLSRS